MPVLDMDKKLKLLRVASDRSQNDVADYLGVKSGSVSSYETNAATPTLETFAKLAVYYNTSADYLLGIDNRKAFSLPQEATDEQVREFARIFNASLKLAGLAPMGDNE